MKRLCRLFIFALLLPLTLWAEVTVPATPDRVVDQAKVFTPDGKQRIVDAILELEKATGGQMVVWTIPSLEGEPIETVSMRAAEKWKIGRKGKDNGAILTIALKDRSMRLEVGYGWEGNVNDARAGDIIRSLGGYFRSGDYAGGAVHAVKQVQAFVTGAVPAPDSAPAPARVSAARGSAEQSSEKGDWTPLWVIIVLILFVILAFLDKSSGGGYRGGGFGGGFRGGGGGFRGGGGRFGGGGASGRW